MEYSVGDLIGMLNLGIIICHGKGGDKVEIDKNAALEMVVYLEELRLYESISK